MTNKYFLVWGGEAQSDGIYRSSDRKMVASALYDFSRDGWTKLIGSSDELINRIGAEKDDK